MASDPSEPTGIPIWFVVWCLVVAAIWLTPAPLVDRFVVGPLVDIALARVRSEHDVSERNVVSMHLMFVLHLRIIASVFAGLYLVFHALTSRWRNREVAS